TRNLGLRYERESDANIKAWADADWAGDPDTRRSRTGYVIMLAGGPISWASRRQDLGSGPAVSLSSTHAEIKSLCSCTRQIVWLRLLLKELGFAQQGP